MFGGSRLFHYFCRSQHYNRDYTEYTVMAKKGARVIITLECTEAKAAGMPTIAAAWGYCGHTEPHSWQADVTAEQPLDLLTLLRT